MEHSSREEETYHPSVSSVRSGNYKGRASFSPISGGGSGVGAGGKPTASAFSLPLLLAPGSSTIFLARSRSAADGR